jgi:Raf kinase inhibitor-like YbhB/YbcL family protein
MDDPDAPAGVWDHWIVVNIPSATTGLPENVSKLPSGAFISPNSWNKSTYIGPCPPGGEHRYAFKLYALDTTLNLVPESRKESIEAAMRGHILAETELMGRYQHGSTK